MVLFYDIIEILHLTDRDRGAMLVIVTPDSCGIGLAPIDGNRLGNAMATKRLGEEARGRPLVPVFGAEEIDRLPVLSTAWSS